MIICCDFDRTLFDTDRLIADLTAAERTIGDPDALSDLDFTTYVLCGASAFLDGLGKAHTLIITSLARSTYGARTTEFSNTKITGSGIAAHADRVEVHEGTEKSTLIARLAGEHSDDPIVMIDDDPRELEAAQNTVPHLRCIQLAHPHTKNADAPTAQNAQRATTFTAASAAIF